MEQEFNDIRNKFNESAHSQEIFNATKNCTQAINKLLELCKTTLNDRLQDISQGLDSTSLHASNSGEFQNFSGDLASSQLSKMAEKFDLRTASNLLPVMDGTENSTKQLIDTLQWYDSILEETGKKLLISFVLKTRISQNAKIRLNQNYNTTEELVNDLRKHFLTQKSASSLSVKLNNARQNGQSVEEFGKSIESLFVNLTIAQAGNDEQSFKILQEVNEKIAINAFASGLQNHDLRTIIKARNYSKLNEAISGAKDEILVKHDTQVFHMRKSQNFSRGYFNRGNFRGRSNFRNNQNFNSHNNNSKNFASTSQRNNFQRFNNRGSFNNFRGRQNSRNNNFRNSNRLNYMESAENQGNSKASQSNSEKIFFRDLN